MNTELHEILTPGEQLLWAGKAESFVTLDVTHKKHFLIRTAVVSVLFIVFIAAYFIFCSTRGIDIKAAFVIIVGALLAVPVLGVFQDAKKLRSASYAVTDKRLICLADGVKSVEHAAIKEALFKTDSDGHVSLLCGKNGIKAKQNKWRVISVTNPDMDEETGLCLKFGFYAVEDHGKLKEALKSFLPV